MRTQASEGFAAHGTIYTARAKDSLAEDSGCGPPRKGGSLIPVGSPEKKVQSGARSARPLRAAPQAPGAAGAPLVRGGMRSGPQQGAAGPPPPLAAPNQDEQLAGQRPHVLAQNALGYESDTTLIQLLSHLPYIFC